MINIVCIKMKYETYNLLIYFYLPNRITVPSLLDYLYSGAIICDAQRIEDFNGWRGSGSLISLRLSNIFPMKTF